MNRDATCNIPSITLLRLGPATAKERSIILRHLATIPAATVVNSTERFDCSGFVGRCLDFDNAIGFVSKDPNFAGKRPDFATASTYC